MEPRIEEKGQFTIIGLEIMTTYDQMHLIPQLWDQFIPRFNEVRNVTNRSAAWGVVWDRANDFTYVACFEVSDASNLPDGMVTCTIPGHTYAVFTHKGDLSTLGATFDYIYKTWLPTSGKERDFTAPFLELYGEDFKGADSDESIMEIWIPIR
jgi:AraC family transcriptional regulator